MAEGEILDLELQEVSLVGTPWHGLVRGGVLELQNGQQRAYPQPRWDWLVDGFTVRYDLLAGICHRLAVPNTPAVVRSPDEAADDAVNGYTWRNEAILSGPRFQLYGQVLDGWIYVDGDRNRWLVTCPAFQPPVWNSYAAPLATTITLTRFGDIDLSGTPGPAESYDHAINFDWSGVANLAAGGTYIWVESLSPTGDRAILRLMFGGYIEVQISGPGDGAAVSVVILRTYAQIQSLTGDTMVAFGRHDEIVDGVFWGTTSDGTANSQFRQILALWYGEDGTSIKEVAYEVVARREEHNPMWDANFRRTASASETATARLTVDGVTVDTVAFTGTDTVTFWGTNEIGQATWKRDVTLTMGDKSTSWSEVSVSYIPQGCFLFLFSLVSWIGLGDAVMAQPYPGDQRYYGCSPTWLSVQVIGLQVYGDTPESAFRIGHAVATPSGMSGNIVDLPAGGATYFGSWNPYTHDVVAWSAQPICWV